MNNTQKFQLAMTLAERSFAFGGTLVRFAGFVLIAYFSMKSVQALAGQQTNAAFIVELLGSIHADQWIAYIVGILGATYGLNEQRLRRNAIAKLTSHSIELESRLDPQRTSSKLTARGTSPGRQEGRA